MVWERITLYWDGFYRRHQTLGTQNKTLYESNSNGVEVHLFEVLQLTEYTYQGVVVYNGKGYQENQTDIDGNKRKVWMFPLELKDGKPVSINGS